MTHTPGPWNIYRDEDRHAVSVLKYVTGDSGGTTGKSICRMATPDLRPVHKNALLGRAEINANAALIAAAPELLDALKALLVAVTYSTPPVEFGTPDDPNPGFEARVPVDFVTEANAAIAKATGQMAPAFGDVGSRADTKANSGLNTINEVSQ